MKAIPNVITIGLLIIGNHVYGQTIDPKYAGTFTDGIGNFTITELTLNEDGSFLLKTPDPLFPYTAQTFENKGKWISNGDTIQLNPEKRTLHKELDLVEKQMIGDDSVTIKINYLLRHFEDYKEVMLAPFDFDLMTISFNKKNRYYNLVQEPHRRTCAFAPKVKRQVIVDSTNTFHVINMDLTRIGIYTYGFDKVEWLDVSNPQSNYFEITIIQPVDNERTPRNRKLLVNGDKVYYYLRNGKIDKSLTPLIKKA